jgi:Kef-type K+ transport system membrane component KefB
VIPLLLLFALGGLMHVARSFTGASGPQGMLLAFGFLLLTAYFAAKVVTRFGLPRLTGYLIAGIVTGPYLLGLVDRDMLDNLKVVSGVAVCMIALTAGSELNLKQVKPVAGILRGITVFAIIGAMFALAGVLYLIRPLLPWLNAMPPRDAMVVSMMIGVALSAQSPAVVMALVSETRAEGPVTRIILAAVVVADLVVILCYAVASTVVSTVTGGSVGVLTTVVSVGWELLGSIGFGIGVGAIVGQILLRVSRGASLFAVMICLVVAEVGQRILLDPLIVMLAAGIWLENFSPADASKLLHDIESASLPVFLVFFALAGAKIDIYTLYASLAVVAILAATRATSFFLGSRLATRGRDVDPAIKRYVWFGLVPQAGLALALAILVQKSFPTFGQQASVILFGVVGFNEMVAPVILRAILVRAGEAGKRVESDFASSGH